MAHTYPNILIHIVFSTKDRRDAIPVELQPRLWRYLQGIGKNLGVPILTAGGTSNHVHLLLVLPATATVAATVQKLKANSSRWMREQGAEMKWQEGYGAFSVSASNEAAVRHYIEHQAEHHAKRTFDDEFVAMLRKSGVGFEEEHVFG